MILKKRKIKKDLYDWQSRELTAFQEAGLLSEEKKDEMLGAYEVEHKQSMFLRFVLSFGAILLGLGVLSFVASNWGEMSKAVKYIMLLLSMVTAFGVGWKLEGTYPKTARSLHYVGVLMFGASIFLIGQMFHLGGDYYGAFLAWGMGVIGIGYLLRDRVILTFVVVLFSVYSIGYANDHETLSFMSVLIAILIGYVNHAIGYSRILTLAVNGYILLISYIYMLTTIPFFEDYTEPFYILFIGGFLFGILLLYMKVPEHVKNTVRIQGHVIHAVNGMVLTFGSVWQSEELAMAFSVAYIAFVFYLVRQGSLFSILLLSALVIRFYVDLSFDFMPKSLVFIVAGMMLLATGYWFEKKRKEGGVKKDEANTDN